MGRPRLKTCAFEERGRRCHRKVRGVGWRYCVFHAQRVRGAIRRRNPLEQDEHWKADE